jgi:hypothetical protein
VPARAAKLHWRIASTYPCVNSRDIFRRAVSARPAPFNTRMVRRNVRAGFQHFPSGLNFEL